MSKKRAKNTRRTPGFGNMDGKVTDPWEEGQSGNPAGRPKGSKDGLRAQLNRLLKKMAPEHAIQVCANMGFEVDGGTVAAALAARLTGLAFRGEPADCLRAIDKIEKTTEEPMKQTLEHTGKDGEDINVRINDAAADVASRILRAGQVPSADQGDA